MSYRQTNWISTIMPQNNCENCKRCNPCPVTRADDREGAYYIIQDSGNVWYCTNCFYCEDTCPELSPREYAIKKRRKEEQATKEMQEPIEKIMKDGTLFPITEGITSLRKELGLPKIQKANISDLSYLYNLVLNKNQKRNIEKIESKIISKTKSEIALFLGCLIPYRVLDYELSARNLLNKLSIPVADLPFACCGSTMSESQSEELWLASAAYNFALAEEFGIKKILTLCGGCAGNLRRVNQRLIQNQGQLERINNYLSQIDKKYEGTIEIIHFTEFLLQKNIQKLILEKLDQEHNTLLQKLSVSTQVPCQVIRPEESSPNSSLGANLLANILQLTNISIKSYPFETMCCGSSMLVFNERIAHEIGKKRIHALEQKKVDALIVGCGNCGMNLSVHQASYTQIQLPILFFTEILDFALGAKNERIKNILKKKQK